MKFKYFLTPTAEQDIDEVIAYLAQDNANAADTFLDTLFNAMDLLADNPDMGHKRDDITSRPVKFWTFKWHYLIIYKPTAPIEIVRVLSGYRDIVSLFG